MDFKILNEISKKIYGRSQIEELTSMQQTLNNIDSKIIEIKKFPQFKYRDLTKEERKLVRIWYNWRKENGAKITLNLAATLVKNGKGGFFGPVKF